MDLSSNGYKFIKYWESCRLKPYVDVAGHLTIGFGHLVLPQDQIIYGKGIDMLTAERLLKQDVSYCVTLLNHLLTPTPPLEQQQFDVLTDHVFNTGGTAFLESTLLRDLQAHNYIDVPNQFKRWNHCNGRVCEGLTDRCNARAEVWNGSKSKPPITLENFASILATRIKNIKRPYKYTEGPNNYKKKAP